MNGTARNAESELKNLRRKVDSLEREIQQMRRWQGREFGHGGRPAAAPPLQLPPLLPPVPDFAGFGEGVVWNKTASFKLAVPPHPFLPDEKVLKEDGEKEQRARYFGSFSFILVAAFFVLGHVALQLRNSAAHLRAEGQDIALDLAKHAWVPIVFIYGITGLLVWFCYVHGAVSAEFGIDWEFWVAWVSLGCVLGFVEVILLVWRPGPRDPMLYITAMVKSHLPVSERMDMTKDIIFIAIATMDAPWLAFLAGGVLLASHGYFLWNVTIRAELLEAYFPVFLSTPKEEEGEEEEEEEDDEEKGGGHRCRCVRCGCGRCWRDIPAALAGHVATEALKQTSPARSQIAIWEDLPQAVLMLLFTMRRGRASSFVLMSLLLSALRVLLSRECFSGRLHRCLRHHLEKARAVAFRSGNAYRALAITQAIWSVEPGYSAPELRTIGIPASSLRAHGCSAGQLRSAGFDLIELRKAGYEVGELKETGVEAAKLKAAGFTGFELQGAFSLAELKSASCTPVELKALGYSAQELKAVGVPAAELKAASFALAELKGAGFTLAELKSAGFNPAEFQTEGFTVAELKAFFDLADLKDARFPAADFRLAGVTAKQLKGLGFHAPDLRTAGFALSELGPEGADVRPSELRAAGLMPRELQDLLGQPPLRTLSGAGYGARQLREVGFSLASLREAGFTAAQLKREGWGAAHLKNAGFGARPLREAGFEAAELKSVGFGMKDLQDAGCGIVELQLLGFGIRELACAFPRAHLGAAGITLTSLTKAGSEAAELLSAGFTAEELRDGGWALSSLASCLGPRELADAGFPVEEVFLHFGFAKLKAAGFRAGEIKRTVPLGSLPSFRKAEFRKVYGWF